MNVLNKPLLNDYSSTERTVTFRRGRLDVERLGAADYVFGLEGAGTFRRQR